MGSDFDTDWVTTVRSLCDPVFDSANVRFVAQVMMRGTVADALLWEADPEQFAERYPDSQIVDSYGSQWPPPCIDYWVYVKAGEKRAQLCPEGSDELQIDVDLSGDGTRDGLAIGREFARILRVPEPSA